MSAFGNKPLEKVSASPLLFAAVSQFRSASQIPWLLSWESSATAT